MSILREAHDVVINGGEFISNQTTVNVCGQSGIDVLLNASTPEAAVDAGERDYAPSCFPDTRVQYIEDITTWAAASNGDHLPIYWMRGPAGVGKSAIAQTCAQKVKDFGHLGAAFFFSVNGRQEDHTRFFPSLAYQLSTVLDDYRENVNRRVLKDKTLVTKTMRAQFEGLIVEPLRDLKEQGKEVRMRSIFIDGLDECGSVDAQVKIIKLIAASVQAQSTPFRWAIFSRAELHIVSTFELSHISPHCRRVHLPISRDSDKEIETYLRGGFENILRRRHMALSSPWPTDKDIKTLVDAAAGLFGYCATVLRFIDTHSFSGFRETLQAVLDVIARPGTRSISPFDGLDRLYTLILQRVPEDLLPSVRLFLRWMTSRVFPSEGLSAAIACNILGFSETVFKSICNHLQAVMTYHEPMQSIQVVDHIDFTCSFWDQKSILHLSSSLLDQTLNVHGTVGYLHKSFHDFLFDPERSSAFSVLNEPVKRRFNDLLAQQHHHFSSSYHTESSRLILAPGVTSSSTTLSWPQGTECMDSYLKLLVYVIVSSSLPHVLEDILITELDAVQEGISIVELEKLAEWDFRKYSIAESMIFGLDLQHNARVLGRRGHARRIDGTIFKCTQPEGYDKFNPARFLAFVETYQKSGVIKAYHPHASSALSLVHNSYSRIKPGRKYGLYELGRGEKSVVWYWEFDDKKRYYHEFRTVNYAEAMRIYRTEKFKMWEESWVPPL